MCFARFARSRRLVRARELLATFETSDVASSSIGCSSVRCRLFQRGALQEDWSGLSTRLQGSSYSGCLSSCSRCFCLRSDGKAARKHLFLSSIFMLGVWVKGHCARSRQEMGLSADSNHAAMLFGIWCEHGGFVGGERVDTFTSCVVHTCGKHWTACIVCALDFELRVCSALLSSSVNIESCRISGTLRLSTASTIKFQFTHFTSTSDVSLRCP
jgi:hypothetical protein